MILPKHHAVFREGNIKSSLDFFRSGLEERGINPLGNPDVMFLHYDAFGIDEARDLISISLNAPISGDKKIIILSFGNITLQAQNALLKLFEEPSQSSEFFIASRNANVLIPTLRSRVHMMRGERSTDEDVQEFLNLSIGERLKEIDKILRKYKEDGERGAIEQFLRAIHLELEKNPKENAEALRASADSISYINATSASIKLLLESVALNI